MVYSNNFIATVKVDGKILRENKDVVALPFGSEYSIYLKNQNSVRAIVRVSVDGQPLSDVADGWIIIGANQTLDLERFIRNGNFQKGNRLKFIERTAQIEEHKGIGIEDGLVRVEYKFEKVQTQWLGNPYYTFYNTSIGGIQGGTLGCAHNSNVTLTNSDSIGGTVTTTGSANSVSYSSSGGSESFYKSAESVPSASCLRSATKKGPSGQSRTIQAQNMCMMQETSNDAGITVAGSESNQKFSWGSYFPTEDTSHVITLKLVGRTEGRPITVKQKPVCTTCGKVNKATFKFCGRCGTALQLL
jgi:hypothetical protein